MMATDSFNLLSWLALAGHIVLVVLLAIRVIMRRRPVGVSLAWLLLMLSIPLAGVLLYGLIGERSLGRWRARRSQRLRGHYQEWISRLPICNLNTPDELTAAQRPLHALAQTLLGPAAMPGNRLTLLSDAHRILERIAAAIDRAHSYCHLEFYIWQPGGAVDRVEQALRHAAERGVSCRVLLDSVGAKQFLASANARALADAGVELVEALPANLLRLQLRRLDLRQHRKLVIIDDAIAWTGSLNMIDPRHFKQESGVGRWVDAMVELKGPGVLALDALFVWDWELETGQGLEILDPARLRHCQELRPGDARIQVVPSGPGYHKGTISQLLLTAIYSARRELVMTTPYFVPDESLFQALIGAALRGVQVRIILPARVDSVLVRYASGAYFDDLLKAGVKIYRYTQGLLHTKSLCIDGHTALFGTVNLDVRSLWLNFEVTLCIYSERFGQQLRALQQQYLEQSEPLDNARWHRRSKRQRFLENSAQLLSPLL